MIKSGWLRLALPTFGLLASFSLLTVICLAGQDEPPKPAENKKLPPFPLRLWAQATPDDYIDDTACAECHDAYGHSFERSPHALFQRNPKDSKDRQGCQSCHGPGKPHLEHLEDPAHIRDYIFAYTNTPSDQRAQACLRCHEDTMRMTHWRRTDHAQASVGCDQCHSIHYGYGQKRTDEEEKRDRTGAGGNGSARTLRPPIFAAAVEPKTLLNADEATLCGSCHPREISEFRSNFHHPVPEGRVICSDCHEVHPTRAAQKRRTARTRLQGRRDAKELCATCHAEKAGPFAFEHDPAAGWTGEGCTECHRPHGSQNPGMLKAFSRGLCNQCHTDKHNNHFPGRTCWQSGCHVAVHGSHTDPLLLRR